MPGTRSLRKPSDTACTGRASLLGGGSACEAVGQLWSRKPEMK